MSIETASYIKNLNSSYPEGGSARSEGDDHLRLIKQVLLNTFPNLDAQITRTSAQLNKAPYDLTTLTQMLGTGIALNGNVPACLVPSPEITFGWHSSTKRLRALVGGTTQTGGLIAEGDFTGGNQRKALPGYQNFPGDLSIQGGTFSRTLTAGVTDSLSISLPAGIVNVLFVGVEQVSGTLNGYVNIIANTDETGSSLDVTIQAEVSGARQFRWVAIGFLR